MHSIGRRAFLQRFLLGAGCFAVSAGMPFRPFVARAQDTAAATILFPHGVASGDPQPDAVALWTRAVHAGEQGGQVPLIAQVSTSADFTRVVAERPLIAPEASDNTVRLIVEGLRPYTSYYYRFTAMDGTAVSVTGRTRTAPAPDDMRAVRFAFASCQNYEQGFYGAWRRMVRDDEAAAAKSQIDFVIHLGDFIYEVRGDTDPSAAETLRDRNGRPRMLTPFPQGSKPWPKHPWGGNRAGASNAVTLDDYRHLYKTYLSDPDLQAARARFPFICTWDDHEFSNNCWQTAETYFGDAVPAQSRRAAANQAWFEFIPAILTGSRAPDGVENAARDFTPAEVENAPFDGPGPTWLDRGTQNLRALGTMTIYRSLRWGKFIELLVTDTRSYRSPPVYTEDIKEKFGIAMPPVSLVRTLDAGRDANASQPDAMIQTPKGAIPNPRKSSPSGTMLGPRQKAWFKAVLKKSDAPWKIWANSVPATPLRIDLSSVPFAGLPDVTITADSWGGYPGELRELMGFCQRENITNFVSVSGDHHLHAACMLSLDPDAAEPEPIAAELSVAGISSASMFSFFERAARGNGTFHAMTAYESGGELVENWNLMMMEGANAALLRAWTPFETLSEWAANRRINPFLSYVDSRANGYGIADVTADSIEAQLVTVGPATIDYGPEGAPVLRRVWMRLPSWKAGDPPKLAGPIIEGTPPHPFA